MEAAPRAQGNEANIVKAVEEKQQQAVSGQGYSNVVDFHQEAAGISGLQRSA